MTMQENNEGFEPEMGKVNDLIVFAKDENGFYLGDKNQPVFVSERDAPTWLQRGDKVRVFVYSDRNKWVGSFQYPKALLGDYAWLKCTDVTDIGAFFDWGLRKNIFVPKALMQKNATMGTFYMIKITRDRVDGRLIGSMNLEELTDRPLERPIEPGVAVTAVLAKETPRAYYCIVNNRYGAWLHKKELYEEVVLGETQEVFVRKWITNDRVFEVSMSPDGYEAVKKAMPIIFNHLRKAGGFLPYNDDTPADVIESKFHMSKRKFKQAVGGLLRTGKVLMEEDGIKMKNRPPREEKKEWVERPVITFATPEPKSTPVKKMRSRKGKE